MEGTFHYAGRRFRLVDLPGTYSLLADSIDEQIARDFVLFDRPDCMVVVCDATVLERNLNLVLQVLEISSRVVVCVNLMDEANRKRIALEARVLERELGVPVVPTAARRGQGLEHLAEHMYEVASGRARPRPRTVALDPVVEEALGELVPELLRLIPDLPCPRWVGLRLLEGDPRIETALRSGELARLAAAATRRRAASGAGPQRPVGGSTDREPDQRPG